MHSTNYATLAACALALASACTGSETTEPNATISGSVQSTDASGISDVPVSVRRGSDSPQATATTDSAGRFVFTGLRGDSYRVSARIPIGYTAASPSDTAQTVSVSSGGNVDVTLRATPITRVARIPRAGASDTFTVAGGQVIVSVPSGTPAFSVEVASTAANDAGWGVPIGGQPLRVSITPAGAGTSELRSASSITGPTSLTLKLQTPSWLSSAFPEANVLAQGFGPNGSLLSSWLDPITELQADPATGQRTRYSIVPLSIAGSTEPISFRAGVSAANPSLTCASGFDLITIPNPQNQPFGPEALVLIHGINLTKNDCDEYEGYEPDRREFSQLITALQAQPEIVRRYRLYAFKYPAYAGVDNASDGLSRYVSQLTNLGRSSFSIVAHSMGGLVIRRFLAKYGATNVRAAITLGTPHSGTALADATNAEVFASPAVEDCYKAHYNDLTLSRPLMFRWRLMQLLLGGGRVTSWLGLQTNSQGLRDLQTSSPFAKAVESNTSLLATLGGITSIGSVNHDEGPIETVEFNSVLTVTGCYLESRGEMSHDNMVPVSSARPTWSAARGPRAFQRDHWELQAKGNRQDDYVGTIINYLLLSATGPAPQIQIVSGNNQVGNAGQPLPAPIVVEARTAVGQLLPNVVIQFTPVSAGGVVTPSTITTNGQGQAVVNWTLGPSGGIQQLSALIAGYATATISAYAVTIGGSGCPNYQPYAPGTQVTASLSTSDCTVIRPPATAIYYSKDYAAPVPQTQAIQVTMTSLSFRSRADVHIEPSGWSLGLPAPTGSNTSTTNALLAPGAFAARMTTDLPGRTGSFTWGGIPISANVTGCTAFLLTSGVVTAQQLLSGDCQGFGKLHHRYLVGIPPGWTITVSMNSSLLDAYLELYQSDDVTFVAYDDDSGAGTDSRLVYTSPTNSSYYLHATSYSGQQAGPYTLSFVLTPPPSGAGPAMALGRRSAGMIPAPLKP